LLGDYSKAKRILGWEPTVKFNELVEIMYKSDFDSIKKSSNIEKYFNIL
jgi:GDPmannose 4,6-dehydratase